jgi:hypothetical protein
VEAAIFPGASVKGGPNKELKLIYIDITANRLPECRILPFM